MSGKPSQTSIADSMREPGYRVTPLIKWENESEGFINRNNNTGRLNSLNILVYAMTNNLPERKKTYRKYSWIWMYIHDWYNN